MESMGGSGRPEAVEGAGWETGLSVWPQEGSVYLDLPGQSCLGKVSQSTGPVDTARPAPL
jgi:hypothetical protein